MNSGKRPTGTAKGKQPNTGALCQTPPPTLKQHSGLGPNAFGMCSQMMWLGRGPHECYPDRKSSAFESVWHASVDSQHIPYLYPSECGGKADVQWMALLNAKGAGLLYKNTRPMQARSRPLTPREALVPVSVNNGQGQGFFRIINHQGGGGPPPKPPPLLKRSPGQGVCSEQGRIMSEEMVRGFAQSPALGRALGRGFHAFSNCIGC